MMRRLIEGGTPLGEVNVIGWLNILLAVVAVTALGLLVREVVGERAKVSTVASAPQGAMVAPGRGSVGRRPSFSDYAVIGSSGLLGVKTPLTQLGTGPIGGTAASSRAATASASGLMLLGTVVGRGGNDFAVFRDKASGREEVIRRGAKVFNVGVLDSVEKYKAVVDSGGKKIVFSMELTDKERAMVRGGGGAGPGFGMLHGPGSLLGPGGRAGGLNPFTGRPVSRLAKPLGSDRWLVDRRALDEALKDSSRVLSEARFIPYHEGGVVKGFMLSQVRPYGIFFGMGLRSGDIILRVNDYAIDAPEKAMSLMKGLKGETDVKVDLLRRGSPRTFKYEIR